MPMNPRLMRPLAAAPSGPSDPDFASVALLLHMDGTNGSTSFPDSSGSPKTVTPYGGAAVSTAQAQWGSGSVYLDGDGDYLRSNVTMDWSSDFTLEFWFRRVSTGGGWLPTIFEAGDISGSAFGCHIYFGGDYMAISDGMGQGIGSIAPIPLDQWIHFALVRAGGVNEMFLDGVSQGTSTQTFNTSNDIITIGGAPNYGIYFDGYIDDFRLTPLVARYGSSGFTPPTGPFPNQ